MCVFLFIVGLWQSTSLTRYVRPCLLTCLVPLLPSCLLSHFLTSPLSPSLPYLSSLSSLHLTSPLSPPSPPSPPLPSQLALRAGNEKDADESADTVGCCSLRVEHISEHPTALFPSLQLPVSCLRTCSYCFDLRLAWKVTDYTCAGLGIGVAVVQSQETCPSSPSSPLFSPLLLPLSQNYTRN